MTTSDSVRFGIYAPQVGVSFAEYAELWSRAEREGLDVAYTFDHVRPEQAAPGDPCLEATALVAMLAARTTRLRVGTLVLAAPSRHPALVALWAATVDHASGGRLELGLGAGGGDAATRLHGLPFPPVGQRMDALDGLCHGVRRMWSGDAGEMTLEPRPLQDRVPLVIGGSGETRLLRIAAEHADVWNTFPGPIEAYAARTAVLHAHCRDLGRDPAAIRRSVVIRAVIGDDAEQAADQLSAVDPDATLRTASERGWLSAGTAEDCVAAIERYRSAGANDFILAMRPPYDWRTFEHFARDVAPAVRIS